MRTAVHPVFTAGSLGHGAAPPGAIDHNAARLSKMVNKSGLSLILLFIFLYQSCLYCCLQAFPSKNSLHMTKYSPSRKLNVFNRL